MEGAEGLLEDEVNLPQRQEMSLDGCFRGLRQ